MANIITMMTIAPNAAKIESTFTNIVVKTYAVTIYFATSKNHFPISLFIFTISKLCCKNTKNK